MLGVMSIHGYIFYVVAEGLIFVLIQLKGEIELGNLLLDGDYFI
jgi:hypothetical protein